MYRFYFLILILSFAFKVKTQDYSDYKAIDSLTYRQYIQQDWKPLIRNTKQAIKNGVDYYYLRMRKGIAEYETRKYFAATTDFKKALVFNKDDKTAHSYCYSSLFRSGKKTMAYKYSQVISESQKKELGIHIKTLDELYVYGGYSLSNNLSKNGNINLFTSDTTNHAEQMLIGDQVYLHTGLSFNLGSSLSIYTSFSFLNIQKQERFQYKTVNFNVRSTTHMGNGNYINLFNREIKTIDQKFNDAIKQEEVYLNAKLQLNRGWSANLFGNLLLIQTNHYNIDPVISLKQDTLSFNNQSNTYLFITHQNRNYEIYKTDTSYIDWVVGFNLQKDFGIVVLNLSASASKIFSGNQYQSTLSATYYPFKSMAFYGTTGVMYYYESGVLPGQDANRFLVNQLIGIQITKKIWVEGEYIYGDLKNTNLKQGLVVYNLPDKINYTIGAKLYIFAGNHLMINLQGCLYDKSSLYFNYSGADNLLNIYTTNYQTISIIGGIIWII